MICNYGIEYVDDPATARKIPTCHRASFESIQNDENFNMALEYADVVAQKIYRDEAREIDRIREEILAVSRNEQPYDIFICYKESAEDGERTVDSVIAQDLYDTLTDKGYKVFFARISLEDKLGSKYEPYIFAALNSAKIMLSIGTKYEYFHAVWVKNEWSRFLKLMAKDKSKVLIPCYKDMDAYDMPDEFKALQAQDLGKVGAVQDLIRGIEKIIPQKHNNNFDNIVTSQADNNPTIDSLLKRISMFLEEQDWKSAKEYCEKVLDINPESAEAYSFKLCCEFYVSNIEQLSSIEKEFETSTNYNRILQFASPDLKKKIEDILAKAKLVRLEREEAQKEQELYDKYELALNNMETKYIFGLMKSIELFDSLGDYKDSKQLKDEAKKLLEIAKETQVGETISTPMDGKITRILKKKGDMVSKGDTLLILEAMLMENEIMSAFTGMVTDVFVSENQAVKSGQNLVSIVVEGQEKKQVEINKQEQFAAQRRYRNVCQHCGGTFKGLFTKKCSVCGKEKDY